MGEINQVFDIAKEVVGEVYEDGAKPVVKPTGELIGILPRTIKAALSPLEVWILQKEYNVKQTRKLLEEKLKNVNLDNICSPEPHIAVPAMQYISYCMNNDELRDMYANLLANSMNKVVKNGVHPAFVEIIRQLSPDEEKILKAIKNERVIPTVTLRAEDKLGRGQDVVRDFSVITETANCENIGAYEQYFDNLIRLGLLKQAAKYQSLAEEKWYQGLETNPFIIQMKEIIQTAYKDHSNPKIERSYIYMTSFGIAFCKICLGNSD